MLPIWSWTPLSVLGWPLWLRSSRIRLDVPEVEPRASGRFAMPPPAKPFRCFSTSEPDNRPIRPLGLGGSGRWQSKGSMPLSMGHLEGVVPWLAGSTGLREDEALSPPGARSLRCWSAKPPAFPLGLEQLVDPAPAWQSDGPCVPLKTLLLTPRWRSRCCCSRCCWMMTSSSS